MILGIDTGGTFTDFVLLDGDKVRVHKCLSTPDAPERAILQGMQEMGLTGQGLRVAHGSTVATNAVLEGRGASAAYVANEGFTDILLIGRQNRASLYDLQPPAHRGPLEDLPRFAVPARMDAEGQTITPLEEAAIEKLRAELKAAGVESVAINLLFSFRNDGDEVRLAEALAEDFFVARSSQVLPSHGEYERGMATWLNAYIGPKVADYILRLQQALPEADLKIMQSSGGLMDADNAPSRAVHLLLSGPAGGLRGLMALGEQMGESRLLSVDMGGTSSDVAMLDGEIGLSQSGSITAGNSRLPVPVPMVDLHTIGAGGGSIAWLDEGGVLRVGPASAGATPGPACYGQGGSEPTVTDANLILGRIPRQGFAGGMALDYPAAEAALAPLAAAMDCDIPACAQGIVTVVEEAMVGALRIMSVERGSDPRDFVLAAFGGAGGLHVCALAERLDMQAAMVPAHAGVLSALGMTLTPPSRELTQSILQPLETLSLDRLKAHARHLEQQARAGLASDGVPMDAMTWQWQLALRYQGQSHALNLSWTAGLPQAESFHEAHRQAYGHALDRPVELVSLRLSATGQPPLTVLPEVSGVNGVDGLDGVDEAPSRELAPHQAVLKSKPVDHRPCLWISPWMAPC